MTSPYANLSRDELIEIGRKIDAATEALRVVVCLNEELLIHKTEEVAFLKKLVELEGKSENLLEESARIIELMEKGKLL